MKTRSILVAREDFSDLSDSEIAHLVSNEAETYYAGDINVDAFSVHVRSEQYMDVQLPDDYDRAECAEILEALWK
jgi:hypothetical protein